MERLWPLLSSLRWLLADTGDDLCTFLGHWCVLFHVLEADLFDVSRPRTRDQTRLIQNGYSFPTACLTRIESERLIACLTGYNCFVEGLPTGQR